MDGHYTTLVAMFISFERVRTQRAAFKTGHGLEDEAGR